MPAILERIKSNLPRTGYRSTLFTIGASSCERFGATYGFSDAAGKGGFFAGAEFGAGTQIAEDNRVRLLPSR